MVMTGDEIRRAYLDFFEKKGHLLMASAPLIPQNDPTILWINAGMAPFKNYFNGIETPPRDRVATSQKCIRTNDIENVGKTDRHHTFFEMLGNFSFGDYFKKEAINWAWEFVTEVLNLEKDRLWITIYLDDDEAFDIWHNEVGLPEDRILRMGKKDNFWEIGTGMPCGPCSEIHYDRGIEYGDSEEDVIGGEGDRYLEIWNLVFTQYVKTESGEYELLTNKNIDTGMGLERVASILQGVDSNFETDLLKPMINFIEADSGIKYTKNEESKTAFRVIADHSRGATMAIFDGALPGNEGRGYVIRRIIRRAVRFGTKINYTEPFLYKLVPVVIKTMKTAYPELEEKLEYLQRVIKSEEERFLLTLDQGLLKLNEMIDELKNEGEEILSGENAFKLYDTYGFPLDLTNDVLEEEGLSVDEEGFEEEMEKQRKRAREAREAEYNMPEQEKIYRKFIDNNDEVEFSGYERYEDSSKIIGIISEGKEVEVLNSGEKGEIILTRTPFYAESGGQVGDKGIIRSGDNLAEVYDTRKKMGLIIHYLKVQEGTFEKNQEVNAKLYADLRKATARNHSATHLLHKALREVLGDHVKQAGSLVEADRLRFDFNHFNKMTVEEIALVEEKVNKAILSNLKVETMITSMDEAREAGVTALFGEKYGEEVRVVSMGDYSKELCAGTHVAATGEIGFIKVLNESSVAAGVRRIEAITGEEVLNYINKQDTVITSIADRLKTTEDKLIERVDSLVNEQKELEKEINSLKDRLANSTTRDLLDEVEEINGVNLLATSVDGLDNAALRKLSDQFKEKLQSGIIVLGSSTGDKVLFVASVTDDLVKEGYHAGKIVSKVAKVAGGGGGGRPDMAQAGARDASKIDEALQEAKKIL
ncbi:MAG: alanine--tRNA ligase [Halanaerobiaceae bacterium]